MKQGRTSFIIWIIFIAFYILSGMAFYPVLMQGDMFKQITGMFENPFFKTMLSAFGTNLDVMTNILGYYTFRSASFVMILGSFFSMLLAGRILAQEEQEKTAEFLLSKPVTRSEVVWSKLAAFFSYLLFLNVFILIVGFISMEIFRGKGDYPLAAYLIHSFYVFLLMLVFGAIGFFISLWIKRGRPVIGVSIGVIIGGYLIDIFSKLTASVENIGYLSPFKFVDNAVLLPDYSLSWWRLLYFLGISLVLFTLSFFIYKKKDILV
jgi:ABC-2 type transport system permease protein